MDSAAYLDHLQSLLPPGDLWPRGMDAGLTKLLAGLAEELARVDARAGDLLIEADPRTTAELLGDFETTAGLPDPCVPDVQSVEARRARLVSKLTSTGGQSRAYYIAVAAALGYTVTIEEFDPMTVLSSCTDPVCGPAWRFAWRVNSDGVRIDTMTTASACTEPIRRWGNELLECVISQIKPAHTHVQFGYSGA